jgi:uncharacterized protein (TIGR02001 family)
MKKNIALLAALSLGAISAAADDATAPAAATTTPAPAAPVALTQQSAVSYNSGLGYESKYLFQGVQYADSILTPTFNAFYGNWYAGTWFAFPIENESAWSDEMDLYGGYNLKLNDLVTADIGVIHFSYDDCVTGFLHPNNSTEGYVGFNFNTLFKPNIYFQRDFDCLTYNIVANASHSIPLVKDWSLDPSVQIGHTWGQEGYTDYSYWGAKIDFTYTIKDGSTVAVGVRYNGSTERYYIGSAKDPSAQYNAYWYGIQFCTNF